MLFKEFTDLRRKKNKRLGLPDQLNYAIPVDDHTIALKDGSLLAAFACAGPDLDSAAGAVMQATQQRPWPGAPSAPSG